MKKLSCFSSLFLVSLFVHAHWIVLLFWLVFLPSKAQAQIEQVPETSALASEAPTLRFEQLSLEEGLAQGTGNSIMQDKNGFIWIATQGGLHRYDGHELKVFTSTPFDTTALSDSWVWNASEASNGDLWVTTEGGGLNRMNPSTGKAIHYRFDPNDSTSISSDRTFYTLEARNGDLWVTTLNGGLNRMRAGEDGNFSRFHYNPEDPNSISSNVLFGINEDYDGQIWVSSANGINRIDPETESITRYLNDPTVNRGYGSQLNVLGTYIPPGTQGNIWLATGNGLVRMDMQSGDHERFLIESNEGQINPLNFIQGVRPDPNDPNILWVGGPGTGIARFDMRTEQFAKYRNDPLDKNSLRDDQVTSLLLDRSGKMWVGTATEGINAFNPGAVNFTNVKNIPNDPSSLAPGTVWGIYEDSQGSLWVGSDIGSGDYLTQFDAKTREVTWHRHDPNDPNTLLPFTLRCFAEDDSGQFWVAGAGGLSKFNRITGKVARFRHERAPRNRNRNLIFALEPVVGDESKLWVGSGAGLDRFDTRTESYTTILLAPDSTVNEPVVFTVMQAANGTLWVGTNSGLFQVDSSGKATLASAYDPNDTTKISDNGVYSIVVRSAEPDILWLGFGNGGGLNRFDTKTGIARHITTEDGLANNTVYGVLEDDNGTLWMSTNGGISNYDPNTQQFRNYGLNEGLMALEYDQNAYFKGKSGMLYFGSGKGVTTFAPELLSTNVIPPQVVISDVKLFNKSIQEDTDSPLSLPISETQTLTLKYDQNEVTIDFVALHFANPEKNQYTYQLEGFDKEWVEAGNKRSATYTNLPPGDYTFKVNAANADGVWNEQATAIEINVLPPWYLTWWAYALFAVIFGVGVVAVDRLQRYRLSNKEQERAVLREAELRAEAENKRRSDTEELSKIGRAITSTLSVEKIIETVYENVNELMGAAIFGVGIYNKEKNCLDFPATKEEGVVLPPYSNYLDEEHWLSVWSFKNNEEIIISDFDKEYSLYLSSYSAPIVGKSPMSVLYMPLIQKGRTIGVITTQSFTKHAYSEYHVNLLRNLANYAAIALDNASAYRKLDATLNELQTTQKQLVQSEKMASLGELTAGIAHEIQNPLNFVNNFSDVNTELVDELIAEINKGDLEEAKTIANDLKDNEEKIVHHGKRAEEIVRSMLQHSRGTSDKKELINISTLADEYLRLAFHGMRAKDKSFNVTMDSEFDEAIPELMIVPQDIGRVILNLITNAFHTVSERKAKSPDDYQPTVTVKTKLLKGNVEISVGDNGTGIPENIREKIFQPFFSTKLTGEGTGLGLSLSYDIITKGHGGKLTVESQEGEGTTFKIVLPA